MAVALERVFGLPPLAVTKIKLALCPMKNLVVPQGMPKCFLLTIKCTNNNNHHFDL